MKKLFITLLAALLITGTGLAQSSQPEEKTNRGFGVGNPFSAVENFVEQAEVGLAGVIGGEDLKAKALANNAEESLEKARKLSDKNPGRAAKLVEKYDRQMNKSREIAGKDNENLSRQLDNISRNNTQRLEEVKEKLPEEARKGIETAIENSKKNKTKPKPDRKLKAPREAPGKPDNSKTDTPGRNISEKPVKENLAGNKTDLNPRNPKTPENITQKQGKIENKVQKPQKEQKKDKSPKEQIEEQSEDVVDTETNSEDDLEEESVENPIDSGSSGLP